MATLLAQLWVLRAGTHRGGVCDGTGVAGQKVGFLRSDGWEAAAQGRTEPSLALPALSIGRRLFPGLLVWLAVHFSPHVTCSERPS